jgi:predicted TIM-barrel fold metal-dependent hydrolase
MSVFDEPKVDSHCHVLDPVRFPYPADVAYRPAGQEIGTLVQYRQVMAAYGVRHALFVGPNSGYNLDNRCLLDALAQGAGRFKGIAVVRNDAGLDELQRLQAAGIIGVAFNATIHGTAHYADAAPLLERLAALGLFIQVQVERDQLVDLMPLLERSGARILVDHCGRPDPAAGLRQPGFQALLALGRTGRCAVKLSGYQKFSAQPPPYDDALPFVHALIDAFTLDRCVWASDWPYLKAPERLDYGPLIRQVERLLPDAPSRRKLLWETPCRWFGFDACADTSTSP